LILPPYIFNLILSQFLYIRLIIKHFIASTLFLAQILFSIPSRKQFLIKTRKGISTFIYSVAFKKHYENFPEKVRKTVAS